MNRTTSHHHAVRHRLVADWCSAPYRKPPELVMATPIEMVLVCGLKTTRATSKPRTLPALLTACIPQVREHADEATSGAASSEENG